jgi:hypothetical protein
MEEAMTQPYQAVVEASDIAEKKVGILRRAIALQSSAVRQRSTMKLSISEPEPREAGPILVCDEELNDIAEFYHNEHATVGQSYETALKLAQTLVDAAQ